MLTNVSCCFFAAQTCQVGHTGWVYRLVIQGGIINAYRIEGGLGRRQQADGLWTRMDSGWTPMRRFGMNGNQMKRYEKGKMRQKDQKDQKAAKQMNNK